LLPSFTAAPPPAIKEHFQYLDQANAGQGRTPGFSAAVGNVGHPANSNSSSGGVAGWIASMAGVDPSNPRLAQQSLPGISGGTQTQRRLLLPWVFFGSP
jgi:hypothetical protein